jgi:hypothetical protein
MRRHVPRDEAGAGLQKPSERRAREMSEAIRGHRKMLCKRLEYEGFDRLSVDSSTTSELPAAYYQRLAARARRLAEESTTPAIKDRLRAAALEYERLAQRVESETSPSEC